MKVLLDTNIVIHREATTAVNESIGKLFSWLDKLHFQKCYHPLTKTELQKHVDASTVRTLSIKLENYIELKPIAPIAKEIEGIIQSEDKSENDVNDSYLLNELYCGRVDILITEDKKIHKKASMLNLAEKVYSIDSFLTKALDKYPKLIDYKVLSVRKEYFGNINLNDSFFDSLKEDYKDFESWFNKKAHDFAYVCYESNNVTGFLYLKLEEKDENYANILPPFTKKRRLKIGTFKIVAGVKLAERFLFIIFDNARRQKADEIYVTLFGENLGAAMLAQMLEKWGFKYHGKKNSESGEEDVYVRDFTNVYNLLNPRLSYPWFNHSGRAFIVPINPEYHTELFPDSILTTESARDFVENQPHRNAIGKAYVSHSYFRDLRRGDILVFYRTGGMFKGVVTTIGVVEDAVTDIKDEDDLINLCSLRTVLTDAVLKKYWNKFKFKPFIVNFLYVHSFEKRLNLHQLLENKILPNMESVKTITPMGQREFALLLKLSKA
jgi:predicted nucleic acid-binding protein